MAVASLVLGIISIIIGAVSGGLVGWLVRRYFSNYWYYFRSDWKKKSGA